MAATQTHCTLKQLLEAIPGLSPEAIHDLDPAAASSRVLGLTSDSREAGPGVVFVAVRGVSHDGHQYIKPAADAGAVAVLGEDERPPEALRCPYVRIPGSRDALAWMAAALYGNPSHEMKMVGVTGTSGKTTTTYLLESVLAAAGCKVGVIGTVNFRFAGKELPSTHTTPGPVELQALLRTMRDGGCDAVVMEVSSHALKQRRVAAIAFDAMVFTNLSREHLDYHPDMDDYFGSKALLFTEGTERAWEARKHPAAAVNTDDEWGSRLRKMLLEKGVLGPKLLSYGFAAHEGTPPDIDGSKLRTGIDGTNGVLTDGLKIDSRLMGTFNAYNIMGAVGAALGMGLPKPAIEAGVRDLKAVPGRLEPVDSDEGLRVLVDYAHKPDALDKVLEMLRDSLTKEGKGHRLICVFGCGGDRDRTKRPVMGRIAVERSDFVVVTSDNPRTEDPDAIIAEIIEGVTEAGGRPGRINNPGVKVEKAPYRVESDRRKAIHEAVRMAAPGDVVLIAGKGHEDYQIIADPSARGGTRKIHFDDREVAAEALALRRTYA